MDSEKELKNIPGLDPETVVVIKKLGFGSLNMLRSKSTHTRIDNLQNMNAEVDLGEYMKWLVVYGVKEAPFFNGLKTFEEKARAIERDVIPGDVGQFLFNEIKDFNNFEKVEELKKK